MASKSFSALGRSCVDGDIIRGVSLIEVGPAKGHDLEIDRTTILQAFGAAEEARTLKVKADHGSGVFSIIGYLDNFAMSSDGTKLLGDFHIYDSEEEKPKILEIAKKNPQHYGMSMEFDGDDEFKSGMKLARCESISAVALVDRPAANKSLFSEKKTKKNMYIGIESDTVNLQEQIDNMAAKLKKLSVPSMKLLKKLEGKVSEQDMAAVHKALAAAEMKESEKEMDDESEGDDSEGEAEAGDDKKIADHIKDIHGILHEHGKIMEALCDRVMPKKQLQDEDELVSDDDSGAEKPKAINPNTEPETQNKDTSRIDGQGSAKDSAPGRASTKDDSGAWEEAEGGSGMGGKIKPKKEKEMSQDTEGVKAVKELAARLGLRVLPVGDAADGGRPSDAPGAGNKTKKFSAIVAEETAKMENPSDEMGRAKLVTSLIKKYPKEYALSRRVGSRTMADD